MLTTYAQVPSFQTHGKVLPALRSLQETAGNWRSPCQGKVEMSCLRRAAWEGGLKWDRCSGGVALPGADPKTAATGLAPKQKAPNPQSNRAIRCPFWGFWFLWADLLW